jgi:hypothetical protein
MKHTDTQPAGYGRFEILTEVDMKSFIFWYIMPYIPSNLSDILRRYLSVSFFTYSSTLKMEAT